MQSFCTNVTLEYTKSGVLNERIANAMLIDDRIARPEAGRPSARKDDL